MVDSQASSGITEPPVTQGPPAEVFERASQEFGSGMWGWAVLLLPLFTTYLVLAGGEECSLED